MKRANHLKTALSVTAVIAVLLLLLTLATLLLQPKYMNAL